MGARHDDQQRVILGIGKGTILRGAVVHHRRQEVFKVHPGEFLLIRPAVAEVDREPGVRDLHPDIVPGEKADAVPFPFGQPAGGIPVVFQLFGRLAAGYQFHIRREGNLCRIAAAFRLGRVGKPRGEAGPAEADVLRRDLVVEAENIAPRRHLRVVAVGDFHLQFPRRQLGDDVLHQDKVVVFKVGKGNRLAAYRHRLHFTAGGRLQRITPRFGHRHPVADGPPERPRPGVKVQVQHGRRDREGDRLRLLPHIDAHPAAGGNCPRLVQRQRLLMVHIGLEDRHHRPGPRHNPGGQREIGPPEVKKERPPAVFPVHPGKKGRQCPERRRQQQPEDTAVPRHPVDAGVAEGVRHAGGAEVHPQPQIAPPAPKNDHQDHEGREQQKPQVEPPKQLVEPRPEQHRDHRHRQQEHPGEREVFGNLKPLP